MIYTVTFNPAIDYVVRTENLSAGKVNRADKEEIYFGGKGINVSAVLKELDVNSTALGFTAGFTGEAISKGVGEMGINSDFIHLENGFSRINVKIKGKEETERNGKGPDISDKALDKLFEKLENLEKGDTLILAGSIPSSLPDNIYQQILTELQGKGIKFVVDACGDLLKKVLPLKPFLVKPNNFELGEMFGEELETDEDIIKYARKLQEMGAVNVLVSLAENGSILVDENGNVHKCGVCKGEVRNSVGAGDSMVAGFTAAIEQGKDYAYALKLGTACGGATAFSDGLAKKELIFALLDEL